METPTPTPVETTSVTPTPSPETALAALSEAERLEWRKTGAFPDAPAPTETPDEPESDDEPAPQSEAAATPEPAVAQPKPPTRLEQRVARLKEDADLYADTIRQLGGTVPELGTRTYVKPQDEIDHLVRYRQDLLARTNALLRQRPSPPPAAPVPPVVAPAPTAESFPAFEQWIETHPTEDFNAYVREAARHEARQILAEERQQWAEAQATAQYRERVQAFVTEHPDFDQVVAPILALTPPTEQIETHTALANAIRRSPNGPALLYALGRDQQQVFHRLAGLPAPFALYELGKLDASLSQPAAPSGSPQPHTQAPPPPHTLGRKPAEPADPVRGALADGDFRRYSREQTARELAAAGKST